MKKILRMLAISLVAVGISTPPVFAQDAWQQVQSDTTVELRGLSVVSANIAWASGQKGTVLKTVDGEHWKTLVVPEAENLDFRDIQGFDHLTAIAMSAGPGAASRMYKTIDGGASWQLMITNPDPNGFWDAMDFWDANNGVVFGDPVNGQFQVLLTSDAGKTWHAVAKDPRQLAALANEGAFAASGTCLSVKGPGDVWFVTGGAEVTRVFHSSDRGQTWANSVTQIPAAAAARGLFSVAFSDSKHGFAVGGDYQKTTLPNLNGVRTEDGGKTWQDAPILPAGFLSVVTTVPAAPQVWVAGGLTGSGVSVDGGKSWQVLTSTPINALGFANQTLGWAIGPKGLLMKYVGKKLE
ncbi:MAG: glycosyl hydrolase [Pseudomonadota bacterium]